MFTGQEDAPTETNTSTEKSKLVENINSLYLNKQFSDVKFLVGEEEIHAHKAILGVKSERFRSLFNENPEKKEISISKTSPEAFRLFLKYFYTETINIPTETELMLQLLILARQYSLEHLTSIIIGEISTILDMNNVLIFLNGSNKDDLNELRDTCHLFMEKNALQVLSSDSFSHLTRESLIQILQRDTFEAPEIEIFKSVAEWTEKNNDNSVLEYIRLSLLSISEIVSIVWPTKLVSPETLFGTISEIVGTASSSKNWVPRAVSIMDQNIATVAHGIKVICQEDETRMLIDNTDVGKFVKHTINGENGFLICLARPYYVNYFRIMLCDTDDRCYSYYIETSLDQNNWHRIIDYTKCACRSVQNLYFDQKICQYIKIVGTSNSKGNEFHLVSFEAFCKSKIPRTINGVLCPDTNVATTEHKALVIEGKIPFALLYGNHDNFTYHEIKHNSPGIIVQLKQPYMISSMKLLLYGGDFFKYKYLIETSVNEADWEIAVDRRDKECKSWQDLHFPERVVVFVRITGTYCSCSGLFRCVHFECPS